jgi:hypothetical protein
MAELAIAATVIGGGVMAYGQYQQGQAAKAVGSEQKRISEHNARVAEMQAKEAENKALYEAGLHRRRTASMIGAQRAGLAMAGVSLTDGSPLALLAETAALAETDTQMILREGSITGSMYRAKAWEDRAIGSVSAWEGKSRARAGTMQAGGTLLATLGSSYGMYRKYYKAPLKKGS